MAASKQKILRLTVPFPPSVNCLYDGGRNTNRRFKSDRYKDWTHDATQFVLAFRMDNPLFTTVRTPMTAWYRHGEFNDKKNRDEQNYIKAISDLLVDTAMIEDDSMIRRTISEWADDVEPGYTEVIIAPLDAITILLTE